MICNKNIRVYLLILFFCEGYHLDPCSTLLSKLIFYYNYDHDRKKLISIFIIITENTYYTDIWFDDLCENLIFKNLYLWLDAKVELYNILVHIDLPKPNLKPNWYGVIKKMHQLCSLLRSGAQAVPHSSEVTVCTVRRPASRPLSRTPVLRRSAGFVSKIKRN